MPNIENTPFIRKGWAFERGYTVVCLRSLNTACATHTFVLHFSFLIRWKKLFSELFIKALHNMLVGHSNNCGPTILCLLLQSESLTFKKILFVLHVCTVKNCHFYCGFFSDWTTFFFACLFVVCLFIFFNFHNPCFLLYKVILMKIVKYLLNCIMYVKKQTTHTYTMIQKLNNYQKPTVDPYQKLIYII